MKNVLFVCIHNSARSQMAEAFLNRRCGTHFAAHSAGLEPGVLNPLVVEAMGEIGIDISGNRTKSVFEMLSRERQFWQVITVCDEASAERCPVFPGVAQPIHWGFPDPSTLTGAPEGQMARVREIRDMIQRQVEQWCQEQCGEREAGNEKGKVAYSPRRMRPRDLDLHMKALPSQLHPARVCYFLRLCRSSMNPMSLN